VYYYWYEWTKAFLENRALHSAGRRRKLTTLETMLAGALAGSATVIITNPIWVINTRMTTRRQVQGQQQQQEQQQQQHQQHVVEKKTAVEPAESAAAAVVEGKDVEKQTDTNQTETQVVNGGSASEDTTTTAAAAEKPTPTPTPLPPQPIPRTGTIGTLLALLRHEGPQALFSGVIPALVLVSNPILQYTLFEQLKNAFERRRRQNLTPMLAFFLGALGKLFATTITYPYITVKSQMHVAGSEGGKSGVMASLRRMVKEEGYAGLYKGLGPKLAQSVLTAAFLFAFKDVLYAQTVKLRMKAAAQKALA
jgi:adenine nucleotide transporter 17